jgi:uncharacterized protein YjcR
LRFAEKMRMGIINTSEFKETYFTENKYTLASKFNISPSTVLSWRQLQGFPVEASAYDPVSGQLMYNPEAVRQWLASRPPQKTGRPRKWAALVRAEGSNGG